LAGVGWGGEGRPGVEGGGVRLYGDKNFQSTSYCAVPHSSGKKLMHFACLKLGFKRSKTKSAKKCLVISCLFGVSNRASVRVNVMNTIFCDFRREISVFLETQCCDPCLQPF
jgi:hypothetical protein